MKRPIKPEVVTKIRESEFEKLPSFGLNEKSSIERKAISRDWQLIQKRKKKKKKEREKTVSS